MAEDRIGVSPLKAKVMEAADAAALVKSGMVIGCSGFTTAGFPKAVPRAIAQAGIATNLTLITSASTGDEVDGMLARAGLVSRRYPFQSNKDMRSSINLGYTQYCDMHLGKLPRYLESGFLGEMDYAIIECSMITKDGGVVPTTSLGASASLIRYAKQVILEINTTCPMEIFGMHDVYQAPPEGYIPINHPEDRIGSAAITCDPDKIAAIVLSGEIGSTPAFKEPDEVSASIARNIICFLSGEAAAGRLNRNLAPLQSGVGAVGNAVFAGLEDAGFRHLTMYTEVVQDSSLKLIKDGIIDTASTTSLSLSKPGLKELYQNLDFYKEHIILRSQDISNHPEIIRRLGIIAINTAAEVDIYGNVNSSHATGSSMINGIGGSGDFSRNARLSIFMTPSTGKGGAITRIVPMVTHVDNCEHDVDVIITEYGIADLRGKSPTERAQLLINHCSHPAYRPLLQEYYARALRCASGQHTPHDLRTCFDLHLRYLETGSMLSK